MNAFSNRHSHRRIGILIVVSLTLIAVAITAVAQNASTSRRAGGETNSMIVSDISLTRFDTNRLQAMVEVEASNDPVDGAAVRARLTVPSGRTYWLRGRTDSSGQYIAQFPSPRPGTYMLEVTDVSARGMSFDRSGSPRLEATLTIGGEAATPIPTATADDPTPTEEEPTPTEETPTATEETPVATEEEPTSTATEEDPTATAEEPPSSPGGSSAWHAPTDHEHGDAPPRWADNWSLNNFGHGVVFGGDEQTPNENAVKHNAFKGFTTTMKGVELFFRVHAQSNPHGRAGQFHSYEIYARDSSGGVSFWQGWTDCGSPDTARFPRSQGDPGQRPGLLVVDQPAWDAGIRFEQWYCMGPTWSWDLGWTIGETSTIWHPGEHLNDPMNKADWTTTGSYGLIRRVEAAWYGPDSQYAPDRGNPPQGQWFCATPKGEITNRNASGPNGCGGDLPQFIALSMVSVEFPDNAVQKQFPGSGNLSLPN